LPELPESPSGIADAGKLLHIDTGGKSQRTWIPGASEACGPKATMWNTKGLQRSLGQQRTDKGGTKDRQDLLGGENPACPLSHLC
jgi:hypothetical protein